MLKDDFVSVGVGQGGGKMVKPFYDSKYRTFFINTSYEDLKSLNVDERYIYHIPAAKGCAKKRDVALNYAKNYYEQMVSKLLETHPTGKVFIFHYTLGGGTGGGLTNFILATMKQILLELGKDDVKIMAVAAKPKTFESYQIQNNAKQSLKELYDMTEAGVVDQYMIINNDSRTNLDDINEEHMDLLDRWIEGEEINNTNNTDGSERMDLFDYSGSVVLFDFASDNVADFKSEIKEAYNDMIYCEPLKQPEIVGMAINQNMKEEEITSIVEDTVGAFPRVHFTPTKNSNIFMLAGMSVNPQIENNIANIINEKLEKLNKVDEVDVQDVKVNEYTRRKRHSRNSNEDSSKKKIRTMEDVMKYFN